MHKIKKSEIEKIWGQNRGKLLSFELEDLGFDLPSVVIDFEHNGDPKNRTSTKFNLTQKGFLDPFNIKGKIISHDFNGDNEEILIQTIE